MGTGLGDSIGDRVTQKDWANILEGTPAVPANGLDIRGDREKKTKDISQVSGFHNW